MISPDPANTLPDYPWTFREFQNCARLYVIGALNPAELAQFKQAAAAFGARAERFIRECCTLRDAFALSLRPKRAREGLRDRLTSMVRQREQSLTIETELTVGHGLTHE